MMKISPIRRSMRKVNRCINYLDSRMCSYPERIDIVNESMVWVTSARTVSTTLTSNRAQLQLSNGIPSVHQARVQETLALTYHRRSTRTRASRPSIYVPSVRVEATSSTSLATEYV